MKSSKKSFHYIVEKIFNNLHMMGYPFSFEKNVTDEYTDILLPQINKKVRFQNFHAQFVVIDRYDLYDMSVPRSVSDIGYKPMKGLQHYDFYGLKEELTEISIFQPEIMREIFSNVDFIFKDVSTYCIHSEPELVPFESRTRTLFLDEGICLLIHKIVMELKEIWNPYDHFLTYVVDTLQHQKLKEGTIIDNIVILPIKYRESDGVSETTIQYQITNKEKTLQNELIFVQEVDKSPVLILMKKEGNLRIKKVEIDSRSENKCRVLLYEDIEFYITYYR
jgi:hypothetical protein